MDIFVEEIVAKKKKPRDFALILAAILLGALLLFVFTTIIMPMFPQFMSIIFLMIAGICYGLYYLLGCFNIEYEYSLVNGEIDIDKIVNRRKRKRLVTVYLRELEDFGTIKTPAFKGYKENAGLKKVYACSDDAAEDTFFVVCVSTGERMMVVFSPSERIVDEIKKRNPQKELI